MGVVKSQKKTKNEPKKIVNGKNKDDGAKVKKKKGLSCLQCIKPADDGGVEGKYRVAAPELMQDTFMSDSEDEGGEVECPIQQQQQYRYMNSEAGTLHRAKPLEDSVTDGHLWPSNNDRKVATIDRQPLDIGFLVSFVVDARGGAMKAKRRGGVRIIVPPSACSAPTRVTCRAASKRAPVAAPPPLMEGEALASRLLELQPQGARFLGPVIIEVPIFTAPCRDREIVILRSDTGETWQDHFLQNADNPLIQEALARERSEHGTGETIGENGERVTRVVTCDFPHYLCAVSRVRQEVHAVGPDGGAVSSKHIPQVQAVFPAGALTKRIRVGLQAHACGPARRRLPRLAAASPVVTVEPRRRKFHRAITLTVPLPAGQDGKIDKQATSSLRLLCSIMGGQARAVWEDVTGSTPLTITDDVASFTTTVSARFWLMNCQNVSDATKLATDLYREMLLVPFEVRIVVLGKRLDALEGRLLVLYITDRYAYDTLLQQEHYSELAHSTAVRLVDGRPVYLEFSGNLIPVTKSGSQPAFSFEAFKDNRVEFPVRVKHHEESPSGRLYFMNDPKVAKGEQSQTPACVLDVELPASIAPRAGKSQVDCLNLDQSGFDALNDELSFHWGGHEHHSIQPPSIPSIPDHQTNGHDIVIANGNATHTNDDHKDVKPHVNGNTVHDTDKVKATFDSDEDKTPHNTLEKGKKKEGFFGGLADKVKNVFSHSEDKEDSKESSPKPQPKPRDNKDKDSKEKSPPKPAPRIINEDLLEKVDDMFKDLKSKPARDLDEVDNKIYATKLEVDVSGKPSLEIKTQEVYDQYKNMQPVETPHIDKKTDPFQFYTGCCEGRYKKGEKHRHDDMTVADRIDQVNFVANETLQEITERAEKDVKDGLDKLAKEKDNIKQKSHETKDDLIENFDKVKDDLKADAEEKINNLSGAAHDLRDHVNAKVGGIQSQVTVEIENVKSSAKTAANNVAESVDNTKENLKSKADEIDFLAREKAESLKEHGKEKLTEIESSVQNATDNAKSKAQDVASDLKNKANEGATAVADSIHSVQDNLSHKAQDAKDATNEKLHELGESLDDAKNKAEKAADDLKSDVSEASEKTKKGAKKKAKEGKKFLSGLVSNIFGEKEKVEDEIKSKVADSKQAANDLVEQSTAKKDEIKENVNKTSAEIKQGAENLVQNVQDKKQDVEKAIHDKVGETQQALHETKENIEQSVQNKAQEVSQAVSDKKEGVKVATQEHLDRIRQEAEETTEQIKKSAEDALNAAADKKSEIQSNIEAKVDDVRQKSNEAVESVKHTADGIQQASQQTFDTAKDTALSALDSVESATKEGVSEARDTWEDLQSSAHDTYADFKDETHGLESSARDTLRSFQSSAGDTFDSLDESAKEFVSNVQDKTESNSQQLFCEAKDTFEGFQVSADNKLEDVKGRLEGVAGEVKGASTEVAQGVREAAEVATHAAAKEADLFTSNLNDIGSSLSFGSPAKGLLKDSSSKLLEAEKSQSSPQSQKKGSGLFSKLRRSP